MFTSLPRSTGNLQANVQSTDSALGYCFTITNPAMHAYKIECATAQYAVTTSYYWVSVSTSIPPATEIGPPAQPSQPVTVATSTAKIASSTDTSLSAASPPETQSQAKGFSHGTVIGAATGGVAGVVILFLAAFFAYRRHRGRKHIRESIVSPGQGRGPTNGDGDATEIRLNELEGRHDLHEVGSERPTSELDSGSPSSPAATYNGNKRLSPVLADSPSPYYALSPASGLVALSPISEKDTPTTTQQSPTDAGTQSPTSNASGAGVVYHRTLPHGQTQGEKMDGSRDSAVSPLSTTSATHSSDRIVSPTTTVLSCVPPPGNPPYPVSPSLLKQKASQASLTTKSSGLQALNMDDDTKRKSSAMLAIAGPYLSADQALGEGYWEAEREQLEANERMKSGDEEERGGEKEVVGKANERVGEGGVEAFDGKSEQDAGTASLYEGHGYGDSPLLPAK